MSEYQPVPVAIAEEISFRYAKDVVVIVCYDTEHNMFHTTTYGNSAEDKLHAADLGEVLCEAAGGVLREKVVYEDFRLNAGRLKEENDRLRRRIAELEGSP